MSVTYTSTSLGATRSSSSSGHGSARHQRQSSSSSRSSATIGETSTADLILPPPATAPSPTRSSRLDTEHNFRAQYDQIGAFFGGRPAPNEERRGSDRASANTNTLRGVPPSYDGHTEVESLPAYSKNEEYDATLNRKLFIYGFLFFPFWIVGIIAPFVKPAHDPSRDNRTKEEQDADFENNMRKVEMRWAKRCAAALLVFVIVVTVAVVVGVTVANKQ